MARDEVALTRAERLERRLAEVRQPAPPSLEQRAPSWPEYGFDDVHEPPCRGRGLVLMSFVLAVIVPTLVATAFTTLWASSRYMSEFRVAVRSIQPIKTGGMADLFGFAGVSQASNDSNAVVQYLQSHQAIDDLGGPQVLAPLFDSPSIDWSGRLRPGAPIEEFTRYWIRMVDSYYEPATGTIIVKVTAFEPAVALRIAQDLLRNAEALVNRLSERARQDSVAFAAQELAKAESRLADLRVKAMKLQDKESILDPQASAESTLTLAAKLKEEIARRNAELSAQRARLAPNAPSVRASQDEIAGLSQELERVEAQATAKRSGVGADGRPLSSVLGAFQQIADEKGFAEKEYESALASLETARMDAAKQQVYLATIVGPGKPEEASCPPATSPSSSGWRWRSGSSVCLGSIRCASTCSARRLVFRRPTPRMRQVRLIVCLRRQGSCTGMR